MTIASDETVLHSEDILMKWLNAYEYHRDRSKRAELDALHQVLPLEGSRAMFIYMMVDKLVAINEIGRFIWMLQHGSESKFESQK
jgi:hypothetical protein